MNRRRLIFAFVAVQDFVVGLLARNLDTHRALLAPGIERGRCMIGGWRAWRTFELARHRVPAYLLQSCVPQAASTAITHRTPMSGTAWSDRANRSRGLLAVTPNSPIEFAARSLQIRRAIKQQRHALATGELTIADVMLEPAAALGDRTLFEILR